MEIHRPAQSVRIPTRPSFDGRRPPTSRTTSHTSTTSSHSRDPMPIPGRPIDEPPPPLPPPRYNEELERGIDTAWSWSNSQPHHLAGKLAPIKPSSSLFGGYMHSRSDTRRSSDDDEMDVDDWDRRGSAAMTIRSPSQTNILLGAGGAGMASSVEAGAATSIPSLIRRPPSPTPSNQRLHGERPLAQENFNRSSQAYDQSLLSKIGKTNSPPHHRSEPNDTAPALAPSTQKLSLQTRDAKSQQRLTVTDLPSATMDSAKWMTSPMSASVSPGSRSTWRDYNMGPRSPSNDSVANSLVLDPELFLQSRSTSKPSTSSPYPAIDDSTSVDSRSQRGSYDQAMFGTDQDFANEDNQHTLERRASRQGMKRRALSPPSDAARDDKSPAYTSELYHKISATSAARSPASAYRAAPSYGSVSSTASSIRHGSYASSFAPSLTASSMTSVSSSDRQSPSDPSQAHPFITSAGPVSSPATSIPPSRKAQAQSPQDNKSIARKMSIQTAVNEPRPPPITKLGSYYICECCPKKPRKFDTEEELRSHQMEKQYACQYCNNRFKNKNEAERHQNSLHLRRHSWSCASIPSFQAVFHPSTNAAAPGLSDVCGFCGEEFPNHPSPDWDRRIDHLTTVHKFGECNQGKKFYRADHFRQHLKHSHAGQSGKWTNVLETICLREETPQEGSGISPTGSDGGGQGRGPSSLPAPADVPMGGATIDEAREES